MPELRTPIPLLLSAAVNSDLDFRSHGAPEGALGSYCFTGPFPYCRGGDSQRAGLERPRFLEGNQQIGEENQCLNSTLP